METKKFKCKDEVIYRRNDEEDVWTYGVFSHYEEILGTVYSIISGGRRVNPYEYKILPYEGNEHLVGTTDEPQIPLTEKEIQDTYWNNCTEKEKENLRNSYNVFLKDDERGKCILEKTCGKHNLQADSTDEEVRLEEGEFLVCFDCMDYFEAKDFCLSPLDSLRDGTVRTKDGNNWRLFIRFSDFNPIDMEETKKHILCVKDSRIVRYKG